MERGATKVESLGFVAFWIIGLVVVATTAGKMLAGSDGTDARAGREPDRTQQVLSDSWEESRARAADQQREDARATAAPRKDARATAAKREGAPRSQVAPSTRVAPAKRVVAPTEPSVAAQNLRLPLVRATLALNVVVLVLTLASMGWERRRRHVAADHRTELMATARLARL